MRVIAWMILSICLSAMCAAADFHPFDGPKPILVFIQTNPWAGVIGADTPRVAVYEDGQVIYVKKFKGSYAYYHVTLDRAGLERVKTRLKPLLQQPDLKPHYAINPGYTDQPSARIYLHVDGREFATSVYGLGESGTIQAPTTHTPGGIASTLPPDSLLALHRWLVTLDFPESKPWTPKYIEVMLSDYSYAPHAISWPKQWPGLDSNRTLKRQENYSIFMDGDQLPALQKYIHSASEKTAVKIQGKKMTLSYRDTFPSEPVWRAAFARK